MYPHLVNGVVRQGEKDFFLQNYLDGREYSLTGIHARILALCDGTFSVTSLAQTFEKSQESMMQFLSDFCKTGFLEISERPYPIQLPPLIDKSPHLQEVQIEVTGKCNLWCRHCYAREHFVQTDKTRIELEEIERVFEQMFRANVGRCFLTGGEVFTRKDIPKILQCMKKNRIHVSGIFTNGTIFREDILSTLEEAGIKTRFLVSVDGHDSESHEAIRGKGTFSKTISFIRAVIDRGFSVTVNTVAMKPNIRGLVELRKILEDLGVYSWRLSVPREQGEMIPNKDELDPLPEDIFSLYKKLLLCAIRDPGKMRIQLGSVFRASFLKDGRYYLYHDDSGTCQYKRWGVVISSNGDVLPCPAGIQLPLGNIRETSLLEIWQAKSTQMFKTLPISATECASCEIRQYCGGGCRVNAKRIHGSYLAKDSGACSLYRFFSNEIKPILEEEGVVSEHLDHMPDYPYDPHDIDKKWK